MVMHKMDNLEGSARNGQFRGFGTKWTISRARRSEGGVRLRGKWVEGRRCLGGFGPRPPFTPLKRVFVCTEPGSGTASNRAPSPLVHGLTIMADSTGTDDWEKRRELRRKKREELRRETESRLTSQQALDDEEEAARERRRRAREERLRALQEDGASLPSKDPETPSSDVDRYGLRKPVQDVDEDDDFAERLRRREERRMQRQQEAEAQYSPEEHSRPSNAEQERELRKREEREREEREREEREREEREREEMEREEEREREEREREEREREEREMEEREQLKREREEREREEIRKQEREEQREREEQERKEREELDGQRGRHEEEEEEDEGEKHIEKEMNRYSSECKFESDRYNDTKLDVCRKSNVDRRHHMDEHKAGSSEEDGGEKETVRGRYRGGGWEDGNQKADISSSESYSRHYNEEEEANDDHDIRSSWRQGGQRAWNHDDEEECGVRRGNSTSEEHKELTEVRDQTQHEGWQARNKPCLESYSDGEEPFTRLSSRAAGKLSEKAESLSRSVKRSNSQKLIRPQISVCKIDSKLEIYTSAVEGTAKTAKPTRTSTSDLPVSADVVASKKSLWEGRDGVSGDGVPGGTAKGPPSKELSSIKVGVANKISLWGAKSPEGVEKTSAVIKTTDLRPVDVSSKRNLWETKTDSPSPGRAKSPPTKLCAQTGKRYKFVITGHGKYEKVPVKEDSDEGCTNGTQRDDYGLDQYENES
uniref:non-muscle caldesmon-like n=1 Tax=Myxine glutinosa TaxID=7769 RepID=UPI00358FEA1A